MIMGTTTTAEPEPKKASLDLPSPLYCWFKKAANMHVCPAGQLSAGV